MAQHKILTVLASVGLLASMATADRMDLSACVSPDGRTAHASDAWLCYIGSVMGPSNIAPRADAPARATQNLNTNLFLMVAGPSNVSGWVPVAFDPSANGSGSGGGGIGTLMKSNPIPPSLIGSLQSNDPPVAVGRGAGQFADQGAGVDQVVVPLPGAGVLAAGGLALLVIRRRR